MYRWKLEIWYEGKEETHTSYFNPGANEVIINLDLVEDDAIKFKLTREEVPDAATT